MRCQRILEKRLSVHNPLKRLPNELGRRVGVLSTKVSPCHTLPLLYQLKLSLIVRVDEWLSYLGLLLLTCARNFRLKIDFALRVMKVWVRED